MKIKYLGTAAAEGWPAVFCACKACERARELGGKNIRTRSQALIDDAILLDLCPDTYLHVLRDQIPLEAIASLFVTHSHQDHFYPLELLLRGEPYAHNPSAKVLTVYGNDKVEDSYRMAMGLHNRTALLPQTAFTRVKPLEPVCLPKGYVVIPLLANHTRNEDCLIYLIEREGKRILYSHDSGNFPVETWDFLNGKQLDFVSLDCTNIECPDGNYHMGIPDARKIKVRMMENGCTGMNTKFVLNHFSHNGKLMHQEIEDVVKDDGFVVSYDGMVVEV